MFDIVNLYMLCFRLIYEMHLNFYFHYKLPFEITLQPLDSIITFTLIG